MTTAMAPMMRIATYSCPMNALRMGPTMMFMMVGAKPTISPMGVMMSALSWVLGVMTLGMV